MPTLEQRITAIEARQRKAEPGNVPSPEIQAKITTIIRAILAGDPLAEFDPELVSVCVDMRLAY